NGVLVQLAVLGDASCLSDEATTAAALAVNELVTNSIKHAFQEGSSGRVTVTLAGAIDGWVVIMVDDDGLPFPPGLLRTGAERPGLGLDLTCRLLIGNGGSLIAPPEGSKCFELRLPAAQAAVAA